MKTTRLSIILASRVDDNEVVGSGDSTEAESGGSICKLDASKKLIKFKSQTKNRYLGNSNDTKKPKFLISGDRKVFNHLRQAFTKASILWYFNPECHIWIETNTSGYTIGEVLNQLTSN